MKRLVVGGIDRVYEINRNFRNEGISTQHNPEFTMLEFYEAYSNYVDLMDLNEALFARLAKAITGSTIVKYGDLELEFDRMQRLTMREAVVKYWPSEAGVPIELDDFSSFARLKAKVSAAKNQVEYEQAKSRDEFFENQIDLGKLRILRGIFSEVLKNAEKMGSTGFITGELFESLAEDKLVQPTILYDFPTDISPLSKQKPDDPSLTERFEIYVAGMEIANGFSELNDPAEQERRFLTQMAQGGDEVPKQLDVDYIRALAHGLPPTAGEGIGIDRLTMLLTNTQSIRDVILFPLLRPVNQEQEKAASEGHGA